MRLLVISVMILLSIGTIVSVSAQEVDSSLPDWVRNIFVWYANNEISESELLRTIQYLADEKIIVVNPSINEEPSVPHDESQFLEPTHYNAFVDSPFYEMGKDNPNFYLVDFEDTLLDDNQVISLYGSVTHQKYDKTDSVQTGTTGKSLLITGPLIAEFNFLQDSSGKLPTHAGIVFTDFSCISHGRETSLTLEAFGPEGQSLGKNGPVRVGGEGYKGETDEDTFFGIINFEGLSKIKLVSSNEDCSNPDQKLEFDHLQYGR